MLFANVGRLMAVIAVLLLVPPESVRGAKILMHGRVDDPYGLDARGDGVVLDHLKSVFGESNVSYLAGISALPDGSSADGFDAVIISSSLGSNDIRNKYEDSPKGILFWENAILKLQAGDFQLSDSSGNKGALPAEDNRRFITITDPTHPLAAGLSGDVEVYIAAADTQFAAGNLAPGVGVVGTIKDTANPEYGILYAEPGAELLGDGSDGKPDMAAGRRVMFFLSDSVDRVVFDLLTEDGIKLFDAAVNWVASGPSSPSPDLNGDAGVDAADAGIMFGNWGNAGQGDLNLDGIVDAADAGLMFEKWTGDAVPQSVPEPTSAGVLALLGAGLCLVRQHTERRPAVQNRS